MGSSPGPHAHHPPGDPRPAKEGQRADSQRCQAGRDPDRPLAAVARSEDHQRPAAPRGARGQSQARRPGAGCSAPASPAQPRHGAGSICRVLAAGGRRRADPARHRAPRDGTPQRANPPGQTPRERRDADNFRRKRFSLCFNFSLNSLVPSHAGQSPRAEQQRIGEQDTEQSRTPHLLNPSPTKANASAPAPISRRNQGVPLVALGARKRTLRLCEVFNKK